MEDASGTERAIDREEAPTEVGEQTGWELPEHDSAVAEVLLSKRWERQEGPFRGFGSPRGKF